MAAVIFGSFDRGFSWLVTGSPEGVANRAPTDLGDVKCMWRDWPQNSPKASLLAMPDGAVDAARRSSATPLLIGAMTGDGFRRHAVLVFATV